ncbi:MAG: hypothetical protein ACD_2C00025G0007 [uncultured bacterium (gcode 4)]|uniref:TPM domain-containing protein n=1 Tax=uncultured bacterium (gcode 4) TaxID=1234023 RepID=K2FGF4_9BACT|nr:MAG: hypothetical protein ACD_2C00025G0007 [uncultured bacterium (gcode 4)]
MNLKWVLLWSAFALASQTWAEAAKPLPCPGNSPLVDTVNVLQSATKTKIEDRLRKIDSEMHHQVVVLTINSLEEYWYSSMMELANSVWNGCGVGYRWENTWVVVLYTQSPSKYRINPANTERYITDNVSLKIIRESKSNWVCRKEDVDCRLDFITSEIDKVIRKEFKGPEWVKPLVEATNKFDEAKKSAEISELLNELWMGAVIIVVVGWAWLGIRRWIRNHRRNNKRKELKREIFKLNTSIIAEKQKYPEWFQKEHIYEYAQAVRQMMSSSDETLDNIIGSDNKLSSIEWEIAMIKDKMWKWGEQFEKAISNMNTLLAAYKSQANEVASLLDGLINKWFVFRKIGIAVIDETKSPTEVVSQIKKESERLSLFSKSLKEIPQFYQSISWLDIRVDLQFKNLRMKYRECSDKFSGIYFKPAVFDFSNLEIEMEEWLASFNKAYADKDIDKLRNEEKESKNLFDELLQKILEMEDGIKWYELIPTQIEERESKLRWIDVKTEYASNAKNYADKTGKKVYLNYDLSWSALKLKILLTEINNSYAKKTELDKVTEKFLEFDAEFARMREYIWLWAALAAIIAAELAEAERLRVEELRRVEQARLKKEQEEADAERRRLKDKEDAEERANRRNDSNDNDAWKSGWGSWFGWAWAEDD